MHVVHAWKYKPKVSHSNVFFFLLHLAHEEHSRQQWFLACLVPVFLFWVSGLVTHFNNKWWQIFTDRLYTKCFLKHSKAFFLSIFVVVTCSRPVAEVQVRDCRASLWTTSVRWVMSCCWAWCLMHSRVRTWRKDGGGGCQASPQQRLEGWGCTSACELTDMRVSQ